MVVRKKVTVCGRRVSCDEDIVTSLQVRDVKFKRTKTDDWGREE